MKSERLAAVRASWALAAMAAFAVLRVWPVLSTAATRISRAARLARETADEALARHRGGAGYVEAIGRIRAAIPPDGTYFLVDAGKEHADYLLRFDLAPRRAILLPDRAHLAAERDRLHSADGTAFLVEARPGAAPELLEIREALPPPSDPSRRATETAVMSIAPTAATPTSTPTPVDPREDPLLYGNLDGPAEGEAVAGDLLARGWARIAGEDLDVTFLVDGRPREPVSFRRVDRPDVAAAVRGVGACERAGFEAVLAWQGETSGPHTIQAIFHASDGRHRHLTATRFRWTAAAP